MTFNPLREDDVARPLSQSSPLTVSLMLVLTGAAVWTAVAVTRGEERLRSIEALLQAQDRRIDRLEGRVFSFEAWPGVQR